MTADELARERALDPAHSFIVQAPAGAGKTGLLTQRYLRLLATVDAPEQIVAITFTIKAAAEMRARIVGALRDTAPSPARENEHDRRTRELARLAREHAARKGWKLDQHPARLRVQTIDAFCLALAAQSPFLSRAGAELRINLEPKPLYAAAARRTLEALDDPQLGPALTTVLRHRDNQVAPTLDLVAKMLAQRDQWLPIVLELTGASLRARLEHDLEREVRAHLERLLARWPREHFTTVARLAGEGARRIPRESPRLRTWRESPRVPRAALADLPLWRELADFLLTREGRWRRKFDINDGFAPHYRNDKERLLDLLEELARLDRFDAELNAARLLPDPRIGEEQWEVAQALIDVLKHAAQALEIEFRASGQVDFIAVASAARQALGNAEAPSELALALDYRIRHLLVDEFQDTSVSQFRLLEQLTAGWVQGDGRTLFCVGDPMQSIYRFRQAEVGLFLRTRDHGLAGLALEPLVLTRNFRSQAALVEWSNQLFGRVLAPADDVARGAVKHAPSEAVHASAKPSVTVHPFFEHGLAPEAAKVVTIVESLLARYPDKATIGILVRQRTHVRDIAALLNQREISYQAVELEPLGEQPVVRDLMAIARALLHDADRTAWLSLLRSPVCGITLADLEWLTRDARDATLRELMAEEARRAGLSPDGCRRMLRTLAALDQARARHGTMPLRRRVESVWLELGGPAAVRDRRSLENAAAFLHRLDAIEASVQGVSLPAGPAFEALFEELQARADPAASSRVQVMTVHRAKGLEFDAVLLPGLGRTRGGESEGELLYWMEVPQADGASGLLLAPIARKGADNELLTSYVSYRVGECEDFERARLLYVAATRARRELHLFGHVRVKEKDGELQLGKPDGGSALELLWPVVEPRFVEEFGAGRPAQLSLFETAAIATSPLRRLAPDWTLPEPEAAVKVASALARDPDQEVRPDFDWASEAIRRIGTVVHGELERWSRREQLPAKDDLARARERLARLLRIAGVPRDLLDDTADRALRALDNMLADDRGRWIFSASHSERRSELALTGDIAGEVVSIVIDRTFVDADGTRWLIDFKTSMHEGGDRESFLDNEVVRYKAQLERYTQLAGRLGPQRVRCGLYFPLLRAWREWEPGQ